MTDIPDNHGDYTPRAVRAIVTPLDKTIEQLQSDLTALTMTWRANLETGKEDAKKIEKLELEIAGRKKTCVDYGVTVSEQHSLLRARKETIEQLEREVAEGNDIIAEYTYDIEQLQRERDKYLKAIKRAYTQDARSKQLMNQALVEEMKAILQEFIKDE